MAMGAGEETWKEKVEAYLGNKDFADFAKYGSHDGTEDWWKDIWLSINHVTEMVGRNNINGPQIVKKAFSDALLHDAWLGTEFHPTISLMHVSWVKAQANPGSTPLSDYAEHGYHIGADGMIEKVPPPTEVEFLVMDDGQRLSRKEGSPDFEDTLHTRLLPDFMACDLRPPNEIKTVLPMQADLPSGQIPFLSDLCIPVGRLNIHTDSNLAQTDGNVTDGSRYTNDSILYMFLDEAQVEGVAHAYFAFEKGQMINPATLSQLPISWTMRNRQCATEHGRIAYLIDFESLCDDVEELNTAIVKDRSHIKLIRARRSQLRFCEDEWAAGNRQIFRPDLLKPTLDEDDDTEPTVQGDIYLAVLREWVNEQTRREVLGGCIMLPMHPANRARKWSSTKHFEVNVPLPAFRVSGMNVDELTKRLDKLVMPATRDPDISEFVIRITLQWLQRLKLSLVQPNTGNITKAEAAFCLKLVASAVVYTEAKLSKGTTDLYEALYKDTENVRAKQSLYCAMFADAFTTDCYEVIKDILEQICRADINGTSIPLNETLNPAEFWPYCKRTWVGQLSAHLFMTDLPAELSLEPFWDQCHCKSSDLDPLANNLSRSINCGTYKEPIPGLEESFPTWQHGYLDCTRTVHGRLIHREEIWHEPWLELEGTELDAAVIANLERRIQGNQASCRAVLSKLLAVRRI